MAEQTAKLYRMDLPGHTCPFGLKAKNLLESSGVEYEEFVFHTREEVDAFKAKHDVKTTPQIWLGGERVGGFSDLQAHFNSDTDSDDGTSYKPVIALFLLAASMALAISFALNNPLLSIETVERFIAFAVCLLAAQKLQDIERFSLMFLNYDLLAKRWMAYGKIYPYAEALSGVLMLTGSFVWLSAPIMLFIGVIGAVSVFKAVYIEKRDIKCACVGGDSNVPLGFVSLTENLVMVFMAFWMISKTLI